MIFLGPTYDVNHRDLLHSSCHCAMTATMLGMPATIPRQTSYTLAEVLALAALKTSTVQTHAMFSQSKIQAIRTSRVSWLTISYNNDIAVLLSRDVQNAYSGYAASKATSLSIA